MRGPAARGRGGRLPLGSFLVAKGLVLMVGAHLLGPRVSIQNWFDRCQGPGRSLATCFAPGGKLFWSMEQTVLVKRASICWLQGANIFWSWPLMGKLFCPRAIEFGVQGKLFWFRANLFGQICLGSILDPNCFAQRYLPPQVPGLPQGS